MGIFSGIKNNLLRRQEGDNDYQDIRSNVLNEPPRPEGYEQYEPPPAEPPEPAFLGRHQRQYDDKYRTPSQKRYEELTFDEQSLPGGGLQPASESYDMMEKLRIIEAQLSAIRSQTETINERLKNMEMRLTGRRY
jgi:hypothetical protein